MASVEKFSDLFIERKVLHPELEGKTEEELLDYYRKVAWKYHAYRHRLIEKRRALNFWESVGSAVPMVIVMAIIGYIIPYLFLIKFLSWLSSLQ